MRIDSENRCIRCEEIDECVLLNNFLVIEGDSQFPKDFAMCSDCIHLLYQIEPEELEESNKRILILEEELKEQKRITSLYIEDLSKYELPLAYEFAKGIQPFIDYVKNKQ